MVTRLLGGEAGGRTKPSQDTPHDGLHPGRAFHNTFSGESHLGVNPLQSTAPHDSVTFPRPHTPPTRFGEHPRSALWLSLPLSPAHTPGSSLLHSPGLVSSQEAQSEGVECAWRPHFCTSSLGPLHPCIAPHRGHHAGREWVSWGPPSQSLPRGNSVQRSHNSGVV